MVKCPLEAHFERHGYPTRFARKYIQALCSWSESTFASGLSADQPAEERSGILDRFHDRGETAVHEAPHVRATDCVHCYLIASRVHG